MKKILSMSLILMSALCLTTSCTHEEDDIFDKSAAERLNEASDLYTGRLQAASNGWVMQMYPQNSSKNYIGSGYLMALKFNTDMSVKVGMKNFLSDDKYAEDTSVWEVITDNGPVLTYNSFNDCIHLFTTPETVYLPNGSSSDTSLGTGMGGDYEYIITDAPEDGSYIMLKGKKRATYNLMTPLEDGVDFQSYIEEMESWKGNMFASNCPTFDVFHMGDATYKIEGGDSIAAIYPYDGDKVTESTYDPFLITKRSGTYYLRFRDAIEKDEVSVQEFKYDESKDQFISVDDETFYIEGDVPSRYFNQSLLQDGRQWGLSSGNMSDKMQTLYDAVSAGLKSSSYQGRKGSLTGIRMSANDSGNFVLTISYKYKNSSTSSFNYSLSKNDDNFTFTYTGCDTASQGMLNSIGGVSDFVNVLSQQFIVSEVSTRFNLTSVKLTSVSDSDIWFTLSLI